MSNDLPLIVDPASGIPLAAQLSEQLTWLIAGGSLEQGDELPAVQSVADAVGVNYHTVRGAYQRLAADGLIALSRGRRARVLKYDRTRVSSRSTAVPSFTIGVIIPAFSPFYAPLIDAIEAAAADQLTMVFICNAREDPQAALDHLDRLVARNVDGVIVAGPLLEPGVSLPPRGQSAIVFVDAPGTPGPNVEFDLYGSQTMATGHLVEHGHTRIGYVTPPVAFANVAPKLSGHLHALTTVNADTDLQLIAHTPDFEMRSGREAAEHLLGLPTPPTAIAVATDVLALGVHHAITSKGLRIPQDVALVGNDDTAMASIIRPTLTTIALPVYEAGTRAFDALSQLIARRQPEPTTAILDVKLIVRESCGCEPVYPNTGDAQTQA